MTDPILEKFPFLTIVQYLDQEYLGIIGNSDSQITSFYIFDENMSDELKHRFIQTGDEWWWETNRQIPINIAMGEKWSIFKSVMKLFITKDLIIVSGPCTSLDNVMNKRIKRKQIQLIKR